MFGLISIGEYVQHYQPAVAARLWAWAGVRPGPGVRVILSLSFGQWKRIMEESPRPGRAGTLEGEAG